MGEFCGAQGQSITIGFAAVVCSEGDGDLPDFDTVCNSVAAQHIVRRIGVSQRHPVQCRGAGACIGAVQSCASVREADRITVNDVLQRAC